MNAARAPRLDPPVDPSRDHVLGPPRAQMTLVEYGSYSCIHCHAAHEMIARLRDRFGEGMSYVFRHLPLAGSRDAVVAAEVAEYAEATAGEFWRAHDVLMKRGPQFERRELEGIAAELGLPPREETQDAWDAAAARVRQDFESAQRSGARVTPTFFINGRRYEGAWDETALAEAMVRSLGHRLQTATLDFVSWAPSTGVLLLVMSILAIVLTNSPVGEAFTALWETPFGIGFGADAFALPLIDWINHGLLTVFFLVVGLEVKRELTVGRLASRRAAAFPVAASIGGMIAPALIYLAWIRSGPLAAGWGLTIATDTAFAIALIVVLGERVPVELRVFLTAAVIVDDLVAIAVVAIFYGGGVDLPALGGAVAVTALLVAINRAGVYRPLPYAVLGVVLWVVLHEAGVHATLAGVVLATLIPTRPPANLDALIAQAQTIIQMETASAAGGVLRHGPSEPALRALDAIHDRIESPASRVLRTIEPWSSYAVLPLFALANAGVAWSPDVLAGRGVLVAAIVTGLVVGKPAGIIAGAWLAVRSGAAVKPEAYSWRQLAGAAALAGIGFTMSLFIAGQAFPRPGDFAAAKIAIFLASIIAAVAGVALLARRRPPASAES
ncbi:MAG: Na+/H+ antiporter NhaA [Thermoanaerobaculia bacterium]